MFTSICFTFFYYVMDFDELNLTFKCDEKLAKAPRLPQKVLITYSISFSIFHLNLHSPVGSIHINLSFDTYLYVYAYIFLYTAIYVQIHIYLQRMHERTLSNRNWLPVVKELMLIEWFAVNQLVWSVDGCFVYVYAMLLLLCLVCCCLWFASFYSLT